jgi:hemolysin activation/secretion protein
MIFRAIGPHPRKFRAATLLPRVGRSHRSIGRVVVAGVVLIFSATASIPTKAQQVSQPGFDPRQTEKRFDEPQSGRAPAGRPSALRVPMLSRPAATGDPRPLFDLHFSLSGVRAIHHDQITRAYQPYLGKKVSQADLTALAAIISDAYRTAGFHLSRAIVPPQDIHNGRVRVQ